MTATTVNSPASRPWAERLAVIALFFANGYGIGAWATSIPSIKARLALTDGSLSLVLLAFAIGGVLGMPVAGYLGQRLGSSVAARVLAIVWPAALALTAFATSIPLLVAACFVMGASNGALDVGMNVHASVVERRWGSPIMSFFHACWSLGGLAGAAVGAAVFAAGWEPSWILLAGAVISIALALAAIPSLVDGEGGAGGTSFSLPGWSALPLCLAVLLAFLCEHAVSDWSGVYLRSQVLSSPAEAALGYAFFAGAMLTGRFFGDYIVGAVGRPAVLRFGGALAAAGLLLVALVPVQLVCLIGFIMAGFGLSNIVPALFSAAGGLGSSPAAGIAMAATAGYAGFMTGPPIIGGVATTFGLQVSMMVMAAGAAAIALLAGRIAVPAQRPT
jgi:MFS family permease